MTLLSTRDPALRQISKTRIAFDWMQQTFEVDVFDSHPGLKLMEVELQNAASAVEMPPFLTPVREVTKDPALRNALLIWRKPIGRQGLSAQTAKRRASPSASSPVLASCAAENAGAIPGLRQEL